MLRVESPEEDVLRHSRTSSLQEYRSTDTTLGELPLSQLCSLLWCLSSPAATPATPGEGEAPRTQEGAPFLPVFSPVNSSTPFFSCRERWLKGGGRGVFRGVPDSGSQAVSLGWGLGLSTVPDTQKARQQHYMKHLKTENNNHMGQSLPVGVTSCHLLLLLFFI